MYHIALCLLQQSGSPKMLNKHNAVFLLFSRGVNVGEKEGYVMMAYQCHHSSVIVDFHRLFFFFFFSISRFIQRFTLIYHFIQNICLLVPGGMFTCLLNASSNHIYLSFRKEIDGIVH